MKERLIGLDLLRGLIIILMIFINLFDETAMESLVYSEQGRAIDLAVTSLLPNLFIFLMGFFLIIADSFTAQKLLRKASLLLILGYTLNIIRYPLFMYVGGYVPSVGEALSANMYYVYMVDIYIFAGYACLLLIPLSWLPSISAKAYISFASFVMYLTTQLKVVQDALQVLPAPLSGYVRHIVLPFDGNVYFPMIPWLTYVLLGIGCGLFYKSTDRNNFFKKLSLYGMFTTICGYLIFTKDYSIASFKMRTDFYQHDYSVGIMLIGITLIMPVLSEFFLTKLPVFIKKLLIFTSKHIVFIYCLSWTMIAYLKFVNGWINSLGLLETILYTLVIYFVCLSVAKFKDIMLNNRKKLNVSPRKW